MKPKSPIAIKIGKRIRAIRDRRGILASELAKAIGTSREDITRLENGWNCPSLGRLLRISEVLAVPITEIVCVLDQAVPDKV